MPYPSDLVPFRRIVNPRSENQVPHHVAAALTALIPCLRRVSRRQIRHRRIFHSELLMFGTGDILTIWSRGGIYNGVDEVVVVVVVLVNEWW